jgi:hypothetical protein
MLERQTEDMLDQLLLRRQTRRSQLNIFVFLEDDPFFCFLMNKSVGSSLLRCGFYEQHKPHDYGPGIYERLDILI